MSESFKNQSEGWLEPIDYEKLTARLEREEGILSKPIAEQSLYELECVRDVLKRRIKENEGVIAESTDLLNEDNPSNLAEPKETEKVMDMTHEHTQELEGKIKKYKDDLLIIEGLIESKKNNTKKE